MNTPADNYFAITSNPKTPLTVKPDSLRRLLTESGDKSKTKKAEEVIALNWLFNTVGKLFNLTTVIEEQQFVADWFGINLPARPTLNKISGLLPRNFVDDVVRVYSLEGKNIDKLRELFDSNNLSFTAEQEQKIGVGVEESKEDDSKKQTALATPPQPSQTAEEVETVEPSAPVETSETAQTQNPFFVGVSQVTPRVPRRKKRKVERALDFEETDEKTDENLAVAKNAERQAENVRKQRTKEMLEQAAAFIAASAASAQAAPQPTALTEETDTVDQSANTVDRQNEMTANEAEALVFHNDYVEKQDVSQAYLLKDQERGNVGAGTAASGPSADLWGNVPSQPRGDKLVPERTLDVKQDGTVIEGDTQQPEPDKFTFLPFAKLGGSIVWVPRNGDAAKFFFTSEDYDELASNVEDGNPLTLANENIVDLPYMLDSITKLYMSLHMFCTLAPMLSASTSNRQQIYAEWLELRQISRALVAYQQNTAGMYENASISMRGGIRAAVGAALKPLYEKLKVPEDQPPPRPLSASLGDKRQRAGEMGIVKNEEFNPQFNYEPVAFKRTKFSIPTI